MKLSIGALAVVLLKLYMPLSETQLNQRIGPDASTGTIIATPKRSENHVYRAVPDDEKKLAEAFSSSDEIILDSDVDKTDVLINQSCTEDCQVANKLIIHLASLSDEEAEAIYATAHRLANAVRHNDELRLGLLRIATFLTNAQRHLLINAFYLLEPEHRRSLGLVLYSSPDSIQRLDGIQLMGSAKVLDTAIASRLADNVLEETDAHVREALVRALNQPELLRGNSRVLWALQQMQSIEQDETVRGQALLTRASLSADPEELIEESIAAVQSGLDAYASDGALALERILVEISRNEDHLSAEHKAAIHQLMDDLMTSESMANIPHAIRVSLDDLYVRFF